MLSLSHPWRLIAICLTLSGCASSELSVKNVHTVTPGVLIRGGQPDASGLFALQKTYGIRTVVNLNDVTAKSECPMVTRLGMRYVSIPSNALCPEAGKYQQFLRVMRDRRNAPVYVHCQDGMDRTGMAVAAYRIVLQGWSARRALNDLRAHQEFLHTLIFLDIPGFVHAIDEHRAAWVKAAETDAAAPAPCATSPVRKPRR